jgi:DNA-binding CsgD family transcriptional regulator
MVYLARADAFSTEATTLNRRFNRIANVRLITFLVTATCLLWGVAQDLPAAVGLGLALGAAFVGLVRYHQQLGLQRNRASALRDVNIETIERLARRWENVPLRHRVMAYPQHPYAADLDLFGRASLLHLLDTTSVDPAQSGRAPLRTFPGGAIRSDAPGIATEELRAMGMQPGLERALQLTERVRSREPVVQATAVTRSDDGLTAREREVASLVAAGESNREIAEALVISAGTAEVHVKHILGKLGFKSRAQIAAWVAERGQR